VRSLLPLGAVCALLAASPARPDVLRPVVGHSSWYGETFTFLADLDDESYVQLTFSVTNIGPGTAKGICRAVLVGPDGALWKASERVSRDGWSHRGGPEERLAIGPCAAWSGESAGAEVSLQGGRIRLAYSDRLKRRGPVSMVEAAGERYGSEILFLRGRVEAEIALPGAPARRVGGSGYVDHSRGTVPPKDLARRWIRFRGLKGERGLVILGREAHDGAFSPLWTCDEAALCRHFASFALDREGSGAATAFRARLSGPPDSVLVRSGKLLYRDAPVEELGILGRIVAPVVGSPVTWVYRGSASVGEGPPVDGILEVELSSDD